MHPKDIGATLVLLILFYYVFKDPAKTSQIVTASGTAVSDTIAALQGRDGSSGN